MVIIRGAAHPTTRVACAGGLNGVGKACDGRAWEPG